MTFKKMMLLSDKKENKHFPIPVDNLKRNKKKDGQHGRGKILSKEKLHLFVEEN